MFRNFEAEAHTSRRKKMEEISGHADNFESEADKAHRLSKHDKDDHHFACGGYKHGGKVK